MTSEHDDDRDRLRSTIGGARRPARVCLLDDPGLERFYPAPNGGAATARGPGTEARMALFRRYAPPLAVEAGAAALADAGLAPTAVTLLT